MRDVGLGGGARLRRCRARATPGQGEAGRRRCWDRGRLREGDFGGWWAIGMAAVEERFGGEAGLWGHEAVAGKAGDEGLAVAAGRLLGPAMVAGDGGGQESQEWGRNCAGAGPGLSQYWGRN